MSREWTDYGTANENTYALWGQSVKLALAGKRGQKALAELGAVLDAMPVKRLIDGDLGRWPYARWDEYGDDIPFTPMRPEPIVGEVCALGAFALARGVPFVALVDGRFFDQYGDSDLGAMGAFGEKVLGLTFALASTIAEVNDEEWGRETPEQRWVRVRAWVAGQVAP